MGRAYVFYRKKRQLIMLLKELMLAFILYGIDKGD